MTSNLGQGPSYHEPSATTSHPSVLLVANKIRVSFLPGRCNTRLPMRAQRRDHKRALYALHDTGEPTGLQGISGHHEGSVR